MCLSSIRCRAHHEGDRHIKKAFIRLIRKIVCTYYEGARLRKVVGHRHVGTTVTINYMARAGVTEAFTQVSDELKEQQKLEWCNPFIISLPILE